MNQGVCYDPVNELLPWYVNGTLEKEEESRVEAHLSTCSICGNEVDQLSEFARSMPVQEIPGRPLRTLPPLPEIPSARRSSRVPLLAAASLLLPAMLGIYWAALGFPRAPRPAAAPAPETTVQPTAQPALPQFRATTTLDLGAGPMRGIWKKPSVVLDPGVEYVFTSLVLPTVPQSPLGLELQDSTGQVLARQSRVRPSDDRLLCTYSIPADVFPASGEYALVLHEGAPGESARAYKYPFLVTVSPSPR